MGKVSRGSRLVGRIERDGGFVGRAIDKNCISIISSKLFIHVEINDVDD